MDELIQRYANPGTSEGPLPSRLKPMEIGELAYPGDQNAAHQLAAILQRTIESGELKSVGTVIERYLSIPPKSVERPVVDRSDFAAFLNAQGLKATGRIAEWIDGAETSVEPTVVEPGEPGRLATNDEAVAYAIELKHSSQAKTWIEACREAVRRHFPNYHDQEGKAESLSALIRQRRAKRQ